MCEFYMLGKNVNINKIKRITAGTFKQAKVIKNLRVIVSYIP